MRPRCSPLITPGLTTTTSDPRRQAPFRGVWQPPSAPSQKHEVRVMQGQGSGSIINISSTYGHEGMRNSSE